MVETIPVGQVAMEGGKSRSFVIKLDVQLQSVQTDFVNPPFENIVGW